MLSDPPLLPEVMRALARKRTVFHSEADFQHAFAWELHSRFPESSVRIERPMRAAGKTLHLDFLMQFSGKSVAVELSTKPSVLRRTLQKSATSWRTTAPMTMADTISSKTSTVSKRSA